MDYADVILLTAIQGAFNHPDRKRLAATCKPLLRELIVNLRNGATLHDIFEKWVVETAPFGPPLVSSSSSSAGDFEGDESDSDDSDGFDEWLRYGLTRGQTPLGSWLDMVVGA